MDWTRKPVEVLSFEGVISYSFNESLAAVFWQESAFMEPRGKADFGTDARKSPGRTTRERL